MFISKLWILQFSSIHTIIIIIIIIIIIHSPAVHRTPTLGHRPPQSFSRFSYYVSLLSWANPPFAQFLDTTSVLSYPSLLNIPREPILWLSCSTFHFWIMPYVLGPFRWPPTLILGVQNYTFGFCSICAICATEFQNLCYLLSVMISLSVSRGGLAKC